jgi:hypothetical protein
VYVWFISGIRRPPIIPSLDRNYTPKKNINWGLPPKSAFFVERAGLMESMYSALFGRDPNAQNIMVLSGMGGIGKTQMVSRFFEEHAER